METTGDKAAARSTVLSWQHAGKTVGLVPTMGAFHEGHLSLIRKSTESCDHTVVSIFVNPAQFGPGEDLERYPRTLDDDLRACRGLGVDLAFTPERESMYSAQHATTVQVGVVGDRLEGECRPAFFTGVATVVLKLFQLLPADTAYFGRKDAQQLAVVRRMVADLDLPVRIVGCPTVREADGLAMSSRNRYLSAEQRAAAPALYQSLLAGRAAFRAGERTPRGVERAALEMLARQRLLKPQYMACVDPESFQPAVSLDGRQRLATAAMLGTTRLIDNIVLDESREEL